MCLCVLNIYLIVMTNISYDLSILAKMANERMVDYDSTRDSFTQLVAICRSLVTLTKQLTQKSVYQVIYVCILY